ncbi:AbrB/MazE/SpoVT family DNA-binding domain-containing protein [Endozoicomonas sp. ONNA2]|uniref:AbrB/MazE/SpoVT family DNA-binding domain-containing protein n=1 Tax=Endozoicomonas sp. ONNA2 TaxID=2828741 RepID=UPI002148968F|nr:AbrB/MazE/SpoVT family DNA-binding domain-containing protein [Endozoicomonas sp. ONNA2]
MHKLTAKRQVTIPQSICNKLGLEPGDFIQVFERDGVAHLVKVSSDDLAGSISPANPEGVTITTQAVKSALKSKAANKFRDKT